MDQFESPAKLFIGGAPRSGTTLLNYILDNHPNIASFPLEHSTFEQYYWNEGKLDFFKSRFIQERTSGQQSILASSESMADYSRKIKDSYGKDFKINVDPNLFQTTYLQEVDRRSQPSLTAIFDSLYLALSAASPYIASKPNVKYAAFKQPFFTESFAENVAAEIPNAKFIQMIRDPRSRYASAKKRRVDQERTTKSKKFHINRRNRVLAHTEVDDMSFSAALNNLKSIGPERYLTVSFEELISNPSETISEVCQWLDIPNFTGPLEQTTLGEPAIAGSTLTHSKPGEIYNSSSNNQTAYLKLTNKAERRYHQFLLNKSEIGRHFGLRSEEARSFFTSFWMKYRDEPTVAYLYRLFSSPLYLELPRSNQKRLLQRVLRREAGVSGAL